MLDQSFSADNFRKIFDLENRKGNYLEGKYFPDLKEISKNTQDYSRKLKKFCQNKNSYRNGPQLLDSALSGSSGYAAMA